MFAWHCVKFQIILNVHLVQNGCHIKRNYLGYHSSFEVMSADYNIDIFSMYSIMWSIPLECCFLLLEFTIMEMDLLSANSLDKKGSTTIIKIPSSKLVCKVEQSNILIVIGLRHWYISDHKTDDGFGVTIDAWCGKQRWFSDIKPFCCCGWKQPVGWLGSRCVSDKHHEGIQLGIFNCL